MKKILRRNPVLGRIIALRVYSPALLPAGNTFCVNIKTALTAMKLLVIFLLATAIQLSAKDRIYAQQVTLSLKDAPLEQVFRDIRHQTGVGFLYTKQMLQDTHPVTINVEDVPLKEALRICFLGQPVGYSISNGAIVISRKSPVVAASSVVDTTVTVQGQVSDEKGEPLIGVSIQLKGTNEGTVTDANGHYSLDIPNLSGTLVFSYVGFSSREIPVNGEDNIDVVMKANVSSLDQLVVVGYGQQKKADLTGAISSINNEELNTTTNVSLPNMLVGKLPGLRVVARTGEPGSYNTDFDIRGYVNSPLIIIDGVPSAGSDFYRIDPNDIKSISILKDASASVYGIRAANGVILITTKRGMAGQVQLNYTGTIGWASVSNEPKALNGYQYAILTDEAKINAETTPSFSKEQLQQFKDGTLPTSDWYGLVVRKFAPQMQHSLSASGGNDKIKYFFSLGNYNEEGIWKSGDLDYKRYNFRSNITAEITGNLEAELLLSGMQDKQNLPGASETWRIFKSMWRQVPTLPIYANNNPEYMSSVPDAIHPIAITNSSISGYTKNITKNFNGTVSLKYSIPYITGLNAKARYSYATKYLFRKRWSKKYSLYNYDNATNTYSPIVSHNPSKLSELFDGVHTSDVQISLNYEKSFTKKHNIKVLLLFEQIQYGLNNFNASKEFTLDAVDQLYAGNAENQTVNSHGTSPTFTASGTAINEIANQGLVGRINYDYEDKYLIEGSFRYDGSSKFAPGHRWGFFPALSAGWRLSGESFIKDNASLSFITNLKLRASWGRMGDDAASTFQFLTGYNYPSGKYVFDDVVVSGLSSRGMANPDITWFTATITDIGLDADLWNGKLTFTADVFRRKRTGLLAKRNLSLPETVGAALPQENLNSDLSQGLELQIGHANQIGKFIYNVSGNISFTRNKKLYVERAASKNSYRNWRDNHNNRWTNIIWGYGVVGQFTSQNEIIHAPVQDGQGNRTLLPGDIRYEDYNEDGVIDDNDIHPIGLNNNRPQIIFGTTMNLAWDGFDLNLLVQGAARFRVQYQEQLKSPLWYNGNGLSIFMDRWHHEDMFDPNSPWIPGKYPSTRPAGTFPLNYKSSTFWWHDASYVRLKSIEIGYTLPQKITGRAGLRNVRVFINGYNLLTWSKLKFVDPEHTSNNQGYDYPIMKNYNIGINVTF